MKVMVKITVSSYLAICLLYNLHCPKPWKERGNKVWVVCGYVLLHRWSGIRKFPCTEVQNDQTTKINYGLTLFQSCSHPLWNSPLGSVHIDPSTSSVLKIIAEVLFLKVIQYCELFCFDFICVVEVEPLQFQFEEQSKVTGGWVG